MYRSLVTAARSLLLALIFACAASCASGDISDQPGQSSDTGDDAVSDINGDDAGADGSDEDASHDAVDTTEDAVSDTMDASDTDDASDGVDPDASIDLAYEVCVLNEAGPWEPCEQTGRINFGPVADGESVTRLARIDNIGDETFDVTAAEVASANFEVVILSYTSDDPPESTEEALPITLAGGESLFFEVTVHGITSDGGLDADSLDITMEQGGVAAPTEEVPIVGGFTGCVGQTADCDGDPSNGCEADLTASLDHCGSCNNACSNTNGTPSCNSGACSIACDSSYGDCDNDPATGCEQELSSIPHCGACGEDCALPNATSTCDQQACSFQACDSGYANCDNDLQANGCEINIDVDPGNCGACGSICDFPFASEQCSSGQCNFGSCDPNRHDLNNDLSDGCEYACNKTSNNDPPDINGVDANCDGIDGEVIRAIFVAKSGNDSNSGSPDAPLLTIAEAISTATSTSGLDHIYVSRGVYEERVTLANGVSIYGGYAADQSWTRRSTFVTKIYNAGTPGQAPIGMIGSGVTNQTVVDLVTVEGGSAVGNGVSSYGLHCTNCSALTVSNSKIIAGNGSAGYDGTNGQSGLSAFGRGYTGGPGGSGSCDGSSWGAGGSGGSSGCARTGGAGGRGGSEGSNSGYSGVTGRFSSPAGGGGSPENDGGDGAHGSNGSNGSNGSAGNNVTIVNGFWQAQDGGDGANGQHGNGGSGGGGGGGQGGFWVNDGSGNGGGGGGGGGCGGTAGTGGDSGGGSFGIFLVDSSGITLENTDVTAGNGGDGGDGGDGGNGSSGALGGSGGSYCTGEVGGGGDGGNGGDGGDGGHGGGGRGGDSISVFRHNTTLSLPGTNTLRVGSAGAGGASLATPGAAGEARTN